jgi:drug/metabolite transporter (DMT)-like permease
MDPQGEAPPWLGPVLMCLASLCFVILDTTTKHLALSYPLMQVVWGRYTAQTLLLLLAFAPRMGWRVLHVNRHSMQLLRGCFLLGASMLMINALARLPLTETTAIVFMAPLVVTLLSGLVLKEKARRLDWVAVCCGFAGVLIIARPGGGLLTWAILFPLGTAICNACYQIVTRFSRSSEHPVTTNVYTGLVGAVVLLPVMPLVWQPMAWGDTLLLIGAGGIAAAGHLTLTRALACSSAAALGPYSYVQLIFAAVLGLIVFGAMPDAMSWLGIMVIAAGGLVLSLRRLYQFGNSKLNSIK